MVGICWLSFVGGWERRCGAGWKGEVGDVLNDLCLLVAVLLALLPLPPLIALGENGCLMLHCERCRECASPFFGLVRCVASPSPSECGWF